MENIELLDASAIPVPESFEQVEIVSARPSYSEKQLISVQADQKILQRCGVAKRGHKNRAHPESCPKGLQRLLARRYSSEQR